MHRRGPREVGTARCAVRHHDVRSTLHDVAMVALPQDTALPETGGRPKGEWLQGLGTDTEVARHQTPQS